MAAKTRSQACSDGPPWPCAPLHAAWRARCAAASRRHAAAHPAPAGVNPKLGVRTRAVCTVHTRRSQHPRWSAPHTGRYGLSKHDCTGELGGESSRAREGGRGPGSVQTGLQRPFLRLRLLALLPLRLLLGSLLFGLLHHLGAALLRSLLPLLRRRHGLGLWQRRGAQLC